MRKVFCSMLLALAVKAEAQEDTAGRSLEEVVITTQRMQQNEATVPYSVVLVKKALLQRLQPRTTPEALQGVNGVFVQKTNHGGGSPFVRGLTGNQTLLLIDGVRLNNATFRYGPNQYLNTVDPYLLEKIEVAKGTGSVQYGSDALGGVIHLLTKDPQFKDTASLSGRISGKYMTHNMEKTARGEVDYHSRKWAVTTGITYRNFGHLYGGDTTGRQAPSGYTERSFNAKAKWRLNPASQLTFAGHLTQQLGVPVYHKVVLENYRLNEMAVQQRNLLYTRYEKELQSRWFYHLQATASWQQQKEERNAQKNGSNLITNEKDKVGTAGFSLTALSQVKSGWKASSGIEVYLDKVNSSRSERTMDNGQQVEKRGLYPNNGKHNSYSLYSLHQLDKGNWSVNAGLRLNQFFVTIKDTSFGSAVIRPIATVFNGGITYHLSKRHHFYLNYSEGFRAPNLDDMGSLGVVDFRYEVPAYNLKPEKSASFELGYKLQSARLSGTAALYHMKLYDFINRVKVEGQKINNYQVYQKINSDEAYVKGGEAEVVWEILNELNVRGSIAYAYGQNKSRNEPMRRIPPLNGRLMAFYRKGAWYSTAEWLFAAKQHRLAKGDKEDNRIPQGGTPGWKVLNAYAGYEGRRMQYSIGVQNIGNVDYRTHGSGINGVGRSAWIAVTVRL